MRATTSFKILVGITTGTLIASFGIVFAPHPEALASLQSTLLGIGGAGALAILDRLNRD